MDRRTLIVTGLVTLGAAGLAKAEPIQLPPARPRDEAQPPPAQAPAPPNTTPGYPPSNAGSSNAPVPGDPAAKPETY